MDRSMVLEFFILLMVQNLWEFFHVIKLMEKVNLNIKIKNVTQGLGNMIYILVDNIYLKLP